MAWSTPVSAISGPGTVDTRQNYARRLPIASRSLPICTTLRRLQSVQNAAARLVTAGAVGVTTSRQCYGSCTGCQSVSASCSRSRGSYISRLSVWLPRTSQTTVAFCRTLAVAHCAPTPMTCGSCSCREHITNSVIGVSRPPVLDCGTTFHPDYGGWDLPSTLSDNL